MNKNRPTAYRVSWTTEALNFFLELHADIDDMKIRSAERVNSFANGILHDANLIFKHLVKILGVVPKRLNVVKRYSVFALYKGLKCDEMPQGMQIVLKLTVTAINYLLTS